MRTWNTPAVHELDVRLTASSGVPSSSEHGGYISNGWHSAGFDSAVYEDNGDCVISKKSGGQS